jgi:hypothetical protein
VSIVEGLQLEQAWQRSILEGVGRFQAKALVDLASLLGLEMEMEDIQGEKEP